MLSSLPNFLIIAILMIIGAILGAFINRSIYAWAMFLKRPISPWLKPAEGEAERRPFDKVPVLGWLGRRNRQSDIEAYGKFFWIRPLLIELTWIVFLPWFYFWQMGGGLTGGLTPSTTMGETWFYSHTILLVLMCIGTFIDFDEKTIPDNITIPGTIIALLIAAFAPWFRLPEVVSSMAGNVASSTNFRSPISIDTAQGLQAGTTGLVIAMSIFATWIWALLPKLSPFYVGLANSCRFMFAYALQPKRKNKCEIRTRPRQTPGLTILLAGLFAIGMIAIPLAWKFLPAQNWLSLFTSIVGLGIAGLMIWLIRICGTMALQQEAMGFGDVTLWAMVGAFLGWQATMIGFFIAPFAALLVVVAKFAFRREQELPFGPYLCFGATVALFGWFGIWRGASGGVFVLGYRLWFILGAALLMMVLMLLFIAWRKGMFEPEEHEQLEGNIETD